MPSPVPDPRLPLDSRDRRLYQPSARIGCSGLSLVSVAALVGFFFFAQVVAPALTAKLQAIQLPTLFSLTTPAPGGTPEADLGGVTPLPAPALTPTLTAEPPAPIAPPPPSATPSAVPAIPTATLPPPPPAAPTGYVVVTNTGGSGVYIRTDPRDNSNRTIAVPEKAILALVGPDVTTDGKVWRNVRTQSNSPQTGWVPAQYVAPASGP